MNMWILNKQFCRNLIYVILDFNQVLNALMNYYTFQRCILDSDCRFRSFSKWKCLHFFIIIIIFFFFFIILFVMTVKFYSNCKCCERIMSNDQFWSIYDWMAKSIYEYTIYLSIYLSIIVMLILWCSFDHSIGS